MQSAKEAVSNMTASAKAGMDKTKATVQEKVEKMTAHDPIEKDMATQRKEAKITEAELNKQETREHNAASKQAGKAGVAGGTTTTHHSTTGLGGFSTGGHPPTTHSTTGTGGYTTGGHPTTTHSTTEAAGGYPTGGHHMSAMPGEGTWQPTWQEAEELLVPRGTGTGTGGTTGNTRLGGGATTGNGTGDAYS
ncbi:hypothetical protein L1049_021611 [Liquidambar formosana]|uniref:18 kDa seed maturation protein n=1 Tax=Liquidambar formosana TaxID=63359 RepID=A0AAP0N1P5_LIQFO